jgi:hypothetical protein
MYNAAQCGPVRYRPFCKMVNGSVLDRFTEFLDSQAGVDSTVKGSSEGLGIAN